MPMLCICLGMEILFDRSEEGILEGLKMLDGDVVIFQSKKSKFLTWVGIILK